MDNNAGSEQLQAEFDLIADEYYEQHRTNVAITGEDPEYFAKYKVVDLRSYIDRNGIKANNIFDFGCGIGNSVGYFRECFPESELCFGDVSKRSLEIARSRFPDSEEYFQIGGKIPLPTESQDVVFTACVFHHIPHEQHYTWLTELKRITRPGGVLVIYEHNPLNPLTVRAVNTCAFDVNARLIRGGAMKASVHNAGWMNASVRYKLFFPSFLRSFRVVEPYLSRVFLGAQWRLIARKP